MTQDEIRASWESSVCPCCGEAKRSRSAFAPSCFAALTIFARRPLFSGPDSENYVEAFHSALRHLQLNPTRRKRFVVNRGGWTFRNGEELRTAGYRYQDYGHCRVPGCGQQIYWYRGPDGRQIAVNLDGFQPHRTTCTDPEFFARQREASAGDRKQSRKNRRRGRGGRRCA